MREYLIIIVYIFCSFTALSCKNNDFGEVKFIDLNTQTVVNVSCEQLKTKYSTKVKKIDSQEAGKLFYLFKKLKRADADWNVNARLFGFIKTDAKKIEFCMGNNVIIIEGKKYFVNDSLREYILKITTK